MERVAPAGRKKKKKINASRSSLRHVRFQRRWGEGGKREGEEGEGFNSLDVQSVLSVARFTAKKKRRLFSTPLTK